MKAVVDMQDYQNAAFERACELVTREGTSCAVIQNGKIVKTLDGRGISPLVALYENEPELLRGAAVADRIIGKAAAMALVLGGAKTVWGDTMSVTAYEYLTRHGVEALARERVPFIVNRAGDGCCPIERSVMDIDEPTLGYETAKATAAALRAKAQQKQAGV